MAKSKDRKRLFQAFQGRKEHDFCIRLTDDMISHVSFRKLSGNAIKLYIFMRNNVGEFATETTYSADYYCKYVFCNPQTYYRSRDELINAGLIEWINKPESSAKRNAAAIFEFSNEWYSREQQEQHRRFEEHQTQIREQAAKDLERKTVETYRGKRRQERQVAEQAAPPP